MAISLGILTQHFQTNPYVMAVSTHSQWFWLANMSSIESFDLPRWKKHIIWYWCVGLFQREKPERARKGDTTWCKPWEEFVGWFVHSCCSNPNILVALMFNYRCLVVNFLPVKYGQLCKLLMDFFGLNVLRISQHQVILAIVSRIKPCGCVWKCCVPLNPMVLLIIIPMKNGYFIGNIPNIFRIKPREPYYMDYHQLT